jgi:hypothetical protein
MEAKFFDSLYGGDSAKGIKLCMGITDGDFWTRTNGTANLYKGQSIDDVDFENPEKVADANDKFEIAGGQALSRNIYVVRRTNRCGNEEKTLNAAICVEFDALGNLVENGCNKIIDVNAEQIEGGKIKLKWFYHVIHQAKKISRFNIYSDNGSGIIDYQSPIGSVDYSGRKFYQFVTDALTATQYRFCIRAVADDGSENEFNGQVKIWINKQSPDGIGMIICRTV